MAVSVSPALAASRKEHLVLYVAPPVAEAPKTGSGREVDRICIEGAGRTNRGHREGALGEQVREATPYSSWLVIISVTLFPDGSPLQST